MIELNQIKTILKVAGINQLTIDFDDEHKIVNAYYVFRGIPGIRSVTYQELIDCLSIGSPGALAGHVPEGFVDLNDLPEENEDYGLKRT